MNKISKWAIAIAVCVAGGAAWYIWGTDAEKKVVFQTADISQDNFHISVQATGTLEPQQLIDVGAQVGGLIMELGKDVNGNSVDYASEVKEGELLARIDDTVVELDIRRSQAAVEQSKAGILKAAASIAQAKASIVQAEANFNQAKRDRDRAEKLGPGEALSQSSFDQYVSASEVAEASLVAARAALESATASKAEAEANLKSSETQLATQLRNRDYTKILAPADGTIIVRQVNVGQTVVSSMSAPTLFLIAKDLSHMQIWASVNEADIGRVKPGQRVDFTVDAFKDKTFEGKVNKIRPNATMTSNVVTYIVEIDFENKDRMLLPYLSANVDIMVKEVKDALLVPNTVFNFRPKEDAIEASVLPAYKEKMKEVHRMRAEQGEAADAEQVAAVWVRSGEDKVRPVWVRRSESDGAKTVIVPVEPDSLKPGMQLVTAMQQWTEGQENATAGGTNPFGPKMPKMPKRGTGGADSKGSARSSGGGGHGGPPM